MNRQGFVATSIVLGVIAIFVILLLAWGLLDLKRFSPFYHGPTSIYNHKISSSEILTHPEAHLYYPGATVISQQATGERYIAGDFIDNQAHEDQAMVTVKMSSADSEDQIYQWYNSWLTSHGYSPGGGALGLSDGEKSGQGYHRGKEEFTVFMLYPENTPTPTPTTSKVNTFFLIWYWINP